VLNGTVNENGESTRTRSDAGSVVLGLLQSLGVYLLGLVAFVVVVTQTSRIPGGKGTFFEVIAVASVAASAAGAGWQGRRGRARTASGAAVGTVVWPMVFFVLLAWAFEEAMSHATIPW
jgi:hypothetical protein